MTKTDFKVTSTFNIITRIYKKTFAFCGKTYKYLPIWCLFILFIFYLNAE